MTATSNKIFVGGLPQSCPDDVLSNYFMQYGTIIDCVVMKDRETGNSRGFGFVTFDTTDAVDMVMSQYDDHKINDKWVEVKRAIPQNQMPPGASTGGGKGKGKGGGGGSMPSGSDVRSGDWTCPGCGSNVFASKDACFKCGERKPENAMQNGNPTGQFPGMYGDPYGAYGAYGMYGHYGYGYGYNPYTYPTAPYGAAYGGFPGQYPPPAGGAAGAGAPGAGASPGYSAHRESSSSGTAPKGFAPY